MKFGDAIVRLRAGRLLRTCAVLGGIAILSACGPVMRHHGYMPTATELAGLNIGVDTRETVVETIGAPSMQGLVTDEAYYYVSSQYRHFGPWQPQEIDRQVLVVSFDGAGRLRNVERFGLEAGRVVALSRRVTDDNLPDVTFLGQLIGNIGNIDPGVFIGDD